MASLQEFRQQHPEYNDMDDTALADALHAKFYSDVPKEQYFSSLGIRSAAPSAEPKTSEILGFEKGVGKVLANAATPAIAAGEAVGIPMQWAREGQEYIRKPETYTKNTQNIVPGETGQFFGEMAATLPTMAAGPFIGGALSGYLLRDNDTPEGIATSAALGGIGGKVGDKLVRGIASAVQPTVSKYAKSLMDQGIRLTPGQITGGMLQRTEDKLSSIPFAGEMIANARIRGLEDFNRTAINRSLAPIGKSLPKDASGREAVDLASRELSDNYNRLLSQATFKVDPTYTQNVGNLVNLASNIPEYGNKPLQDFIKTNIAPRLSRAGSISGKEFKEIDELLGQEIKDYSGSQSPNDRKMGRAFEQLQQELKGALGRTNPSIRKQLDDTDAGFANLVRIQSAAATRGGGKGVDPGVFTPAQLANAVRNTDSSVRKNAVARGNALMQDLSDAGNAVLPPQVPDSGTSGRIAAMLAAGGGLGSVVSPWAAAPAGVLAAAYTKPGVKAMEYLLARRPTQAAKLADLLRKNSNLAAPPSAALLAQMGQE